MKGKRLLYILPILLCAAMFIGSTRAPDSERKTLNIVTDIGTFTYVDELITPSDFTVAEQIEKRQINAPTDVKISMVDMCLKRGADYKTAIGVCFPRLINVVEQIAHDMYIMPIDAAVHYSDGTFSVKRHVDGRKLDKDKLYASIYFALKFGGDRVVATASKIVPQNTYESVKANLVFRGSYTTDFSTSSRERAHNVILAASKFGGAVIRAGESISFNTQVGERTEKAGFKTAKIIVDGKYTTGVGGGACQASTAIYNAALVSGLYAAANAHSICPSYCPAGLDAMISSVSDLVITNPTSHSVYFAVCATAKRVTVSVYGERSELKIEPESVIVERQNFPTTEIVDTEKKYFDYSAAKGDRALVSVGKDGIKSETYLNYYKNNILVKREKIRENSYKCIPQVIAVAP